jgi:hypothetical protein
VPANCVSAFSSVFSSRDVARAAAMPMSRGGCKAKRNLKKGAREGTRRKVGGVCSRGYIACCRSLPSRPRGFPPQLVTSARPHTRSCRRHCAPSSTTGSRRRHPACRRPSSLRTSRCSAAWTACRATRLQPRPRS